MFRTILWFFVLALAAIISIPFWIVALCLPKDKQTSIAQLMLDWFCPILDAIAGFKVEISGKENIPNGPVLYVGNHQGLFDMLIALRQFKPFAPFLAKIETSKIPMIGSWMKMMDCVFIDRKNARASLKSIQECEKLLKSGSSIIIFPEGTRSRKHEMGEFKPGAFRCAINAKVPIVPFVIDNSYKAWEEKHKITSCKASLKFLPAVYTDNLEKEKTKHISDEIYGQIKNALG